MQTKQSNVDSVAVFKSNCSDVFIAHLRPSGLRVTDSRRRSISSEIMNCLPSGLFGSSCDLRRSMRRQMRRHNECSIACSPLAARHRVQQRRLSSLVGYGYA